MAEAEEIVATPEQLAACCAHLTTFPILGFDTEFVGEHAYHPELCLVQVAVPGKLYVIDPLATGPLDAFWALLHDPARVSIVHAGREEVRLCRVLSGKPPANLFDLQLAAGLVGLNYPMSHAGLVQQLLGQRMAKGETLTDWRRRPLTPEQMRYAFDDVRFVMRLHEKLDGKLDKLGRREWAKEEFSWLAAHSGNREMASEEERWRKLRGAGALDRRRLAVVKALWEWREERAAQVNRPARTVVRDDLLVEVARRTSAKVQDLAVVRGLQARELEAIARVVETARAIPLEECPLESERDHDPPQMALISNILIAVLGDHCARSKLAVGLVGTNNEVRALVRAALAGKEPPTMGLTEGWRGREVLPVLQEVLEGKKTVRIADPKKDAPLAYS